MNTVVSIGAKARAALEASGGRARPLAAFPDAPYFEAAGEIVWVGSKLPGRHPRAVRTSQPVVRGRVVLFDSLPRETWSAVLPPAQRVAQAAVAAVLDGLGEPRGFGAWLFGGTPAFPLNLAVPRVDAVAVAYRSDDAQAAYAASRALLGLGTGLTPSGDDLCGAALFGKRLVSRDSRWHAVGDRLTADARSATHAISAALFADLAAGASFESLHALADALVAGDDAAAIDAARALVVLGHSSGWDMLTGFVIGIAANSPGNHS